MSKVDEAIVEIDAAIAAQASAHEGLRDFASLNIKESTKQSVNAAIVQYDRRLALLKLAKQHCETLVADGYPALEIPDVSISVRKDLEENAKTIEDALARFSSNAAISLNLSANAPEPK